MDGAVSLLAPDLGGDPADVRVAKVVQDRREALVGDRDLFDHPQQGGVLGERTQVALVRIGDAGYRVGQVGTADGWINWSISCSMVAASTSSLVSKYV